MQFFCFFYTNTIPKGYILRSHAQRRDRATTNKKLKICFLTNLKIYLIKKDSTTISTIFYNLNNIKKIFTSIQIYLNIHKQI